MNHLAFRADYFIARNKIISWTLFFSFILWFLFSLGLLGVPLTLEMSGYDFKRSSQIVLISLLSFILAVTNPWGDLFKNSDTRTCKNIFILIFILLFMGALFSENTPQSLFESLHWALLFSIFLSGYYIQKAALVEKLIFVLLFLHSCLIFKSSIYFVLDVYLTGSIRPSVFYPFVVSIRFFNQIQAFFIPCLVMFILHPRWGSLAVVLLFINLFLALSGGARGLLLSVLATGVIAFLFLRNCRRYIVWALLVFLAVCFFYGALLYILNVEFVQGADSPFRTHSSGRIYMWQELVENMSAAHLILGAGPGAYAFTDFIRYEGHPHNSILQFLYEWGGVATCCLIYLAALILHRCFKVIKHEAEEKAQVLKGVFLSSICAGIYSLLSGIIVMPIPQTLMLMYMGILWWLTPPVSHQGEVVLKISVFTRILSSMLILIILFVYIFMSIYYLSQQSNNSIDSRGPRFWLNGAPIVAP
ncbi:O-antigen ligase family protein [Microbulbifer sp. SSSA002]|uniref:O-antigen ligase family protein n=1 Tax=Microbulbifer sp. SSSA002 TaxID=3243376 RepID=UPI004039B486